MYSYIDHIKYIKDYEIEVFFKSGEKGIVDLSAYTRKGGVFDRFRDMDYFRQVRVDDRFGVLTWPDGVDIAPETTYEMATGKAVFDSGTIKETS